MDNESEQKQGFGHLFATEGRVSKDLFDRLIDALLSLPLALVLVVLNWWEKRKTMKP